jgi:integrative and conjugative element protein (TIGR02256 family)
VSWLPAPGETVVDPSQLRLGKARQLAGALHRLPFVTWIECRRATSPPSETVVFETEVELPQYPALDVQARERIAVLFSDDSSTMPEILALRADFPLVPHLNRRREEFPRSLCVYDDAFPEFSFKWSPVRFIEDIRGWLARTARNELHQPNQPLEPLLEAGALELIVPPSILTNVMSGDCLFLEHIRGEESHRSVLIRRRVGNAAEASMFAVYLEGKVQTHGVIRRNPVTLADLQEFLAAAEIDVIDCTRRALKDYLAHGGGQNGAVPVALLVDLPKARSVGQPPETTERFAFVAEARVEELSRALGISERFEGSVGYIVGNSFAVAKPEELRVLSMRRLELLTPETAAQFNGVAPVSDPMVIVGLGALGSQLFLNLWRSGFGRWTLIDRDLQMPHNDARHALAGSLGECKAYAMAALAAKIFPEQPPVPIIADVLTPGVFLAKIETAISKSAAVIDCSASVAVGRQLARSFEGGRRVSVFLNPSATDLVLLAEPADRSVRLDQLEMMYYRALIDDKRMEGHLSRTDPPVRYSNSCRDLSTVISQDLIATHAGIASGAIRSVLASPNASIFIWRADRRGTIARIDVPVEKPVEYDRGTWKVLLDSAVQKAIKQYRRQRLPNETGGVLLGSFDMTRRNVLVSAALPSPEDSREWPTVYIRGSAGLQEEVLRSEAKTGGGLEYVGEWHSHPDGATAEQSEDDRKALAQLGEAMAEDARPAVAVIVAARSMGVYVSDQLGCFHV